MTTGYITVIYKMNNGKTSIFHIGCNSSFITTVMLKIQFDLVFTMRKSIKLLIL